MKAFDDRVLLPGFELSYLDEARTRCDKEIGQGWLYATLSFVSGTIPVFLQLVQPAI
jgi:hypothetical protein